MLTALALSIALSSCQPPQDIPPLPATTVVPAVWLQPPGWLHNPSNVGGNLRLNQDATTQSQNEFGIAVNPLRPRNFVAAANDYRTGQVKVGFYTSIDGGLSVAADGVLPLSGGFPEAGDPVVAFARDGTAYVLSLDFQRSPLAGGLFLHRSPDGGLTFQPPLTIYSAGNLPDKPYMAVDNSAASPFADSIYVTFTGFGGITGLQCLRSRDGGRSWSAPVGIGSGQGTSPGVGPGGEVYVAWESNGQIRLNSSFNGGVTWAGQRTIQNIARNPSPLSPARFRCNSFPSLAVDTSPGPYRGRVYVAWSSRDGGDSDIFLIASGDRGSSWTAPVRLNDLKTNDQYFQWLTVDEAGVVFACWHDLRNDPGNLMHDCYVTASYDGGRTWLRNWRASDRMSNPGSTTFLGDYCGIAAGGGMVYPTWVDTRSGHQDCYTAPVQADLELSPETLSASAGGPVDLQMRAGPRYAHQTYVAVANFTGVNPVGLPLGGVRFYLNYDPLVDISLVLGNQAPFLAFRGTLDADGIATGMPRFHPTAGQWLPFVGTDTSIQYLVLDGSPALTYGSNPISIRILP